MDVHKIIKSLQYKRNWSLNRMAQEGELNSATVTNWFKRKSVPTIKGIEGICKAFGITVSEFFNESETSPTYLTDFQKELLSEFDLLNNNEKETLLQHIKVLNENRKKSNPQ